MGKPVEQETPFHEEPVEPEPTSLMGGTKICDTEDEEDEETDSERTRTDSLVPQKPKPDCVITEENTPKDTPSPEDSPPEPMQVQQLPPPNEIKEEQGCE